MLEIEDFFRCKSEIAGIDDALNKQKIAVWLCESKNVFLQILYHEVHR